MTSDTVLLIAIFDGRNLLPRRRSDAYTGVAKDAATRRLPRSWPSRPILVTSTLGLRRMQHPACS
jgi:hypothetical protein